MIKELKIDRIYDDRKVFKKSLDQMLAEYEEEGIKISRSGLAKRINSVFEKRGEKKPKAKKIHEDEMTGDEIRRLHDQNGLSFDKIVSIFKSRGIDTNKSTVYQRYRIAVEEYNKKDYSLNEFNDFLKNALDDNRASEELLKEYTRFYEEFKKSKENGVGR